MSSPRLCEPLHFLVGWQAFQFVQYLKALSDTEIAGRQYVEAVEREDKEHMHAPYADTFYLCEVFDDVRTFHFVEHAMLDGAVGEFFGEVFDVRSFLTGEAGRAHFRNRQSAHHFRRRRFPFPWPGRREQSEKARVYRVCRRTRNLLADN